MLMNTKQPAADLLNIIKAKLEDQRRDIDREIGAYPPPIPACDVQFNHLLEQRSHIARHLLQLSGINPEQIDEDTLRAQLQPFLQNEGS